MGKLARSTKALRRLFGPQIEEDDVDEVEGTGLAVHVARHYRPVSPDSPPVRVLPFRDPYLLDELDDAVTRIDLQQEAELEALQAEDPREARAFGDAIAQEEDQVAADESLERQELEQEGAP